MFGSKDYTAGTSSKEHRNVLSYYFSNPDFQYRQ